MHLFLGEFTNSGVKDPALIHFLCSPSLVLTRDSLEASSNQLESRETWTIVTIGMM